jgi:hypothetical protein
VFHEFLHPLVGMCDKIKKAKHLSGQKNMALVSKILSLTWLNKGVYFSNIFEMLHIQKPSLRVSQNFLFVKS